MRCKIYRENKIFFLKGLWSEKQYSKSMAIQEQVEIADQENNYVFQLSVFTNNFI